MRIRLLDSLILICLIPTCRSTWIRDGGWSTAFHEIHGLPASNESDLTMFCVEDDASTKICIIDDGALCTKRELRPYLEDHHNICVTTSRTCLLLTAVVSNALSRNVGKGPLEASLQQVSTAFSAISALKATRIDVHVLCNIGEFRGSASYLRR